MKHFITAFSMLVAAGSMTMTACNNDSSTTSTDSTTVTDTVVPAPADTAVVIPDTLSTDQKFVYFIAPANAKEMKWLESGMAHGGADVKMHSKHMLADHKKMGKDVADYAANHNMTLPDEDVSNTVTIEDKTGKDYDKAWADKMVEDHQGLLDRLNEDQNNVTDPDLKALITKAIPVVTAHLEMAKKLQDKLSK